MGLTNAFYEAVQAGNVRRVRIMMQDSLLVDPTFAEFHDMEKAASSMMGLYDAHDGKEFVEDRGLWNDDYMDKVMVKVLSNFSHGRIDHLKEVVRYLRPVTKAAAPQQEQTVRQAFGAAQNDPCEEKFCFREDNHLGVKIGAGAVVGGAVGGAVASVAGASVVGVIGSIAAGAIIGGVAVALLANGGER